MKIVVCVKQVIDVKFPFVLDPDKIEPIETDIFYTVNPADLCAMEAALRIRENHGGEVIVLSCGPERVEKALRACIAMGGDQVVRIDAAGLTPHSQAKPLFLARAAADLSPDLILCGSQSLDEGTGETPAAMAEHLALPQVTGVMSLELAADNRTATVEKKLERGRRETLECPLPALFSLESGALQPRYAPLTGLLDAHGAQISLLGCSNLGIDTAEKTAIDGLRMQIKHSFPRPRPKKSFSFDKGMTAEERMEMMMSGGMKKSNSDLLEGTAKRLGEKLGGILQEQVWR